MAIRFDTVPSRGDLDPENPTSWFAGASFLLYLFGAGAAAWEFVLKPVFLPPLP